jgi:hypothetical protein
MAAIVFPTQESKLTTITRGLRIFVSGLLRKSGVIVGGIQQIVIEFAGYVRGRLLEPSAYLVEQSP